VNGCREWELEFVEWCLFVPIVPTHVVSNRTMLIPLRMPILFVTNPNLQLAVSEVNLILEGSCNDSDLGGVVSRFYGEGTRLYCQRVEMGCFLIDVIDFFANSKI
jgi:hypothetical protein